MGLVLAKHAMTCERSRSESRKLKGLQVKEKGGDVSSSKTGGEGELLEECLYREFMTTNAYS